MGGDAYRALYKTKLKTKQRLPPLRPAWQKVGSCSSSWNFRQNVPALQNWKAPTAVRAVSVLECKFISRWKPNDFLQKSRKVTEGIQVGFYRWLFLSVQAKPVYPPPQFQGLTKTILNTWQNLRVKNWVQRNIKNTNHTSWLSCVIKATEWMLVKKTKKGTKTIT